MKEYIEKLNDIQGVASILIAICSLVIAIVAIIISIYSIQKQTKISLFQKRYEIYIAYKTICKFCVIELDDSVENKLNILKIDGNELGKVTFLFNKQVDNYTSQILNNWWEIRNYVDALNQNEIKLSPQKISEYNKQIEENRKWFKKANIDIDIIFSKFLKI